MPEMETKFPDFTGKLTEFAVNKLIFIRSNLVNFFVSVFCYFLCFSGVFASPSVPTDFVKLIFFRLQVAYVKLDTFSLLHFTTLLLFLVHAFFLGSSRECEKLATAQLFTFCCRVCMTRHKNLKQPWENERELSHDQAGHALCEH